MIDSIQKALAALKRMGGRGFAVTILTTALAFTVYGAAPETTDRIGQELQIDITGPAHTDSVLYNRAGSGNNTVRVKCDGRTTTWLAADGSVADVLRQAGIELGKDDLVEPSRNAWLVDNMTITVIRRDLVSGTETVEMPYKTEVIPTSLLAPGKTRVLSEGKNGRKTETFQQEILDGEEQEREVLKEKVLKKPVTEKVLVGTEAHPISELDFGYELDKNGEPKNATNVLRSQRAAGYSARVGAKTASGRDAVVGHVAVNPNVIPYGTKLYIKSTDGSFVYGYAIAADTGTALHNGTIAVDLFYGSYMESALNGIRDVDIFILE